MTGYDKRTFDNIYLKETSDTIFVYYHCTKPSSFEGIWRGLSITKIPLKKLRKDGIQYIKPSKSEMVSKKSSVYFYSDDISKVYLSSKRTVPNFNNTEMDVAERFKEVYLPITEPNSWQISSHGVEFDDEKLAQKVHKRIKQNIKKVKK